MFLFPCQIIFLYFWNLFTFINLFLCAFSAVVFFLFLVRLMTVFLLGRSEVWNIFVLLWFVLLFFVLLVLIDGILFLVNFCIFRFLGFCSLGFLCHVVLVDLRRNFLISIFVKLLNAFHLRNSFRQAMWLS